MARITLMDICDGIAATFNGLLVTLNAGTAPVALIAQSYDQLTEGMQDTPALQIFPTDSLVDASTDTDRTTFKGCIKHGEYTFEVRGFARQRSQLGEDMEAVVRLWDALEEVLEDEGTDCVASIGRCTFFGVPGVRSISWSGLVPQTWNYANVDYAGFLLNIKVEVF
jgi:hypothetical protein